MKAWFWFNATESKTHNVINNFMEKQTAKNESYKFYQKVIPILSIPLFLILSFFYAWLFFATATNRNGLWGNMYLHYDLNKTLYCTYLIVAIFILLGSIIFQVKYLLEKNILKLDKTFKVMGIALLILIIFSVSLELRFVGKG